MPAGKYNEMELEVNELGEEHVATVTDKGIYLDHNWQDGGQFIPHEKFNELIEFRREFLREIGHGDKV